MNNFFQYIRTEYNMETSSLMKRYSREVEKLAKSTERSIFLQKCRQFGIIPTHLKNSTRNLKFLFKTKTAENKTEKIETNLHAKLLNVEIRETHITTTSIKKEIKNIERQVHNTLKETEFTKSKNDQWKKYYNIKSKIKQNHQHKLRKMKKDKFEKFNFVFNEEWFINYTNVEFEMENKWLLSLGNKFAMPVNKKNFAPVPLIADIEQWVQNVKDETDKEIIRSKMANRISYYKRNLRNNEKERFITCIYEETRKILKENENKIMITTADKGNKTVVMFKNEYKIKMNKLLEDKITYKTIREDPTAKLQRTNNNIVTQLQKTGCITKFEKIAMTTHAAAAPELYGLPKIHKENIPLRPISSSLKVPCYNLAKYVGQILRNLISPLYNIKNSLQLKEKLDGVTIDVNDVLVSFDVVSLFTNIPIHLAIRNILDKWENIKEHTRISKSQFLKILQFCLNENNYFTFDNKYYHQTYGMPMGNPLSPTIADIVLDTLLDDVIEELKTKNIKLKFISKYVDDLFAVINKDDKKIILETLNKYHNKLQFTVEEENNMQIPYLDMKIIKDNGKLITNWYTKTTASGRIINYHSTQPIQMKLNTATNLIEKVIKISDERFRTNNIGKLRKSFDQNSYPSFLTNKLINKSLNKISKNKTTNKDNIKKNNDMIFYSVPYIPKLTESKTLESMINDEKIKITHKSNVTLRTLFTCNKTKIDKMKIDNVVYEVKCDGNERERCEKVYVGTTKRMLGTRIAEHIADINKGKESTALAQHIKDSGHVANFTEVKILDKEKKENKRYTLESLRIQQRISKTINTKEDKDNTKLQYSIAII